MLLRAEKVFLKWIQTFGPYTSRSHKALNSHEQTYQTSFHDYTCQGFLQSHWITFKTFSKKFVCMKRSPQLRSIPNVKFTVPL